MKLIGAGTDWNTYLFEWRHAAQIHGWDYTIVGLGKKWQGFAIYMQWMQDELGKLPPDELVFVVDTYDALVQKSPEETKEIYHQYFSKPIVYGCEASCMSASLCHADAPKICESNVFPRRYPNGGAMLGPAGLIKKIFDYGVEHKLKDDQLTMGRFWAENCELIELDRDSRLVYNVMYGMGTKEVEGKHQLAHPDTNIVPVLIHMPGQPYDFGMRSRKARRTIIPSNKPMPALGSLYEFADQAKRTIFQCEEMYYIWIPPVVFVGLLIIGLVILLVLRHKSLTKT
jgi:hypothetical protein